MTGPLAEPWRLRLSAGRPIGRPLRCGVFLRSAVNAVSRRVTRVQPTGTCTRILDTLEPIGAAPAAGLREARAPSVQRGRGVRARRGRAAPARDRPAPNKRAETANHPRSRNPSNENRRRSSGEARYFS